MAKETARKGKNRISFWVQLAAIVIGIMITFVGSDIITKLSQRRQLKSVMQFVVEELNANLASFDEVKHRIDEDRLGMLMFKRYDYNVDIIPLDSLENCKLAISTIEIFTMRNDALEVLKYSGIIPSISDKRLLMDIFMRYSALNQFDEISHLYFERKLAATDHLLVNKDAYEKLINHEDIRAAWNFIMADPAYNSFIKNHVSFFGGTDNLAKMRQSVMDTIAAINEKYGFE